MNLILPYGNPSFPLSVVGLGCGVGDGKDGDTGRKEVTVSAVFLDGVPAFGV